MIRIANKDVIKLPTLFGIVFFIWICLQIIILIFNWDFPNHDDALRYELLAKHCIDAGTWYPGIHNTYDEFIFGPAYVNLLIFTHSIFNSFNYIKILNLLLNILLVLEIFILGKRLFNTKIGYISAILYMLIFSNLYVPIAMLTDLQFTFLSMTALLLCTNKNIYSVAIGGICIGLANWFRPLVIIFLIVIIVNFVLNKTNWKYYLALFLPMLLIVISIGMNVKSRTGHYNNQSVTGGFNLAMSSFDEADGLVNVKGFYDTANYIYINEELSFTYMQHDSIFKAASIRWIKENPEKYIAQIPKKLFCLYCEDTWSERVKPNQGLYKRIKVEENNKLSYIKIGVDLFLKSLVYYFILFFFFYYLWKNRLFQKRNIYLIIPLLGTIINLVIVITSRYHYPYMCIITIYAASGLSTFIAKHSQSVSANKIEIQ